MLEDNKYVRFDWAAKRMLRDKANFAVLEGLITVLLNEEVHIVEILESEGNQETTMISSTGWTSKQRTALERLSS